MINRKTVGIWAAVAWLMGAAACVFAADRVLSRDLRGFSGQVRGIVMEIGRDNTFRLEVGYVIKVWENNKASDPETLVNRTVTVGPRWIKEESGRWQPYEPHVAFIRKLARGREITIEIQNTEGSNFSILELSKKQQEQAAGHEESDDKVAEARIEELEAQVNKLKAEMAEFRRLLEERR